MAHAEASAGDAASGDTAAAPTPQKKPPVHLFVLQHGLWGNSTDVSNLEQFLREQLGPKSTRSNSKAEGATSARSAADDEAEHPQYEDEEAEEEVLVLNSVVNKKVLTYDGIDVCGARVVKMVLEAIQTLQEKGRKVSKLSFIGYSLGGLILRYAVGKLYVLGLFEEVACANFVTIASPHLGSWREPTSFWARWFNANVAIVGSRTGRQLMLVDADYSVPWLQRQQDLHEQAHQQHTSAHQSPASSSAGAAATTTTPSQQQEETTSKQQQPDPQQQQPDPQQQAQEQEQSHAELPPGAAAGQPVPLLLLMAHPAGPFHRALRCFRTRMLAANIHYDAMVPYCTASLCMHNPYEESLAVAIDPRYPSVVRPAAAGEDVEELTYKGRRKRLILFAIFSPLAPLLYAWTVLYGVLHHRSARRQALEGTWLHQHAPETAAGVKGLSSSSSSSSSRKGSKHLIQPLLQPAGTRGAASLAAGAGGGASTADAVDGLISTAVQGHGSGDGAGSGGTHSSRSSLERAMQEAAAPTAAADSTSEAAAAVGPAEHAATAAGAGAGGGAFSRRRSDSLAAALQHYQQEDELGRLSKQLSSKGSIKLGLQKQSADGGATANTPTAEGGDGGVATGGGGVSSAQEVVGAGGARTRVTVDRDGIVEAPSIMHQQQAWMAQQLFGNMPPCVVPDNTNTSSGSNATAAASGGAAAGSKSNSGSSGLKVKQGGWVQPEQQEDDGGVKGSMNGSSSSMSDGGWHRVDVCTRHWHAHAAIIIRDYRFENQSRDMFQYICDHMSL